MAASGFRERFAYAAFVFHMREGRPPVYAEIAREVGVTAPWITKWSRRDDAPDSRQLGRALAKALDVSEEWLLDGLGEAPEPDLWPRWQRSRARVTQSADQAIRRYEDSLVEEARSDLQRNEPLPPGATQSRGGIPAEEALAAERAARRGGKKRA